MPEGGTRYSVDAGVATVVIDDEPHRNALSWDMVAGLTDAVARAKADDSVRVVVLTGAGDKAFCAGANLGGMAGEGFTELHHARGRIAELFRAMWSLGKPTIAAVRGYALAGGFGLALACDFVLASDDAQFGAPEIDIGLWPYQISVPMLRSMPPKKALELMTTGRRVGAAEAERIGFVNRVVPAAELDAVVAELASTLAAKSPTAMRLGRDSFYAVLDMTGDEALRVLHPLLTLSTETEDAIEGIKAFQERRPPNWTGR